jgi:aminoglycoside phosphotransferase (APT) family kinase protein
VIRFPRYAEVAADLDRAEALLEFVGAELGPAVRVPKICLRGEPGPFFPHRFFGHELIPGFPASDPRTVLSADLAQDLGYALAQIHGISTTRASGLQLGPQKWHCRSSLEALVEAFAEVPQAAALVPEAGVWVGNSLGIPDEYAGAPRFIHDDFQPEHVVVHADTGRLSGILDWGPALGDPAQDFSFLAATWGWDFTGAVLDAYRGPLDREFLPRLLFLARVRALGWLVYEVEMDLDTSRTESVIRDLLAVTGSP